MKPFQPVAPSFDLLNEALATLLPSDGGNGTALSGRQAASPSTEQLLASRDAILDQLPAPLVISDEQDRILYVNRALLSLINCPEDFLQGKKLSSILIPRAKLDPQSEDAQDPAEREMQDLPDGQALILLGAEGAALPVKQLARSLTWNARKLTLSVLLDLSEQQAANERLLRIAYYDSLTGLPNRDCFMDSLSQELRKRNGADGYTFSVVLLNMDRFKLLNEQYGSDTADKVLIEVAERTKTILHGFATIFRTGGDEVMAILKGVSSQSYLESALDRLLKLISIPIWINGDSVFPSACLTAMLDIPKEFTALQVLSRLSSSMKTAKKRGLGCVLFVSPATESQGRDVEHKDILKVTAEIQTSLMNDQFIPYFQPIYNTATMQLLGFETLARWKHPTSGILPPGAFIPEAEESGLLTAIDRAIVSQALVAMENFTRKYPQLNFHLNANASGLSLKDASFFDFIEGKLKNVTFPPDRFTLEITEDVLMENLGEARGRLEKLKKLNISVALDDFGTGYSSLQYISQLPVDSLKIDRSFIDQMLKSRKTASLVKSVIEMARSLNLSIVAEGIETKDQNQWLAEYNVAGQGFFFSMPLSMEKADEFLKDVSVFAELIKEMPQP